MKYEKPLVILCNGNEKPDHSTSGDDSTSCALTLGCCVLTLYKKK